MFLYLSIVVVILILLILFLIVKYYNLGKRSEHRQQRLEKENGFLSREGKRLRWQISILERSVGTKEPKYNPIFKNRRAIIGNYDKSSSSDTMQILRSFGMSVDAVEKGDDIIDRIENNYKYDVIFTNNIYQRGISGIDTLKHLREIVDFNTPVVIHTISEGKRDYFINSIGFDEYIVKPIMSDDKTKIIEIENVLKRLLVKAN